MAATQAEADDLALSDDETLRWYSPEPTVEYGFCATCGSSMFWRIVGSSKWSICAGVLDPPTGLRTTSAWWLDEASDYLTPSAAVEERRDTE